MPKLTPEDLDKISAAQMTRAQRQRHPSFRELAIAITRANVSTAQRNAWRDAAIESAREVARLRKALKASHRELFRAQEMVLNAGLI